MSNQSLQVRQTKLSNASLIQESERNDDGFTGRATSQQRRDRFIKEGHEIEQPTLEAEQQEKKKRLNSSTFDHIWWRDHFGVKERCGSRKFVQASDLGGSGSTGYDGLYTTGMDQVNDTKVASQVALQEVAPKPRSTSRKPRKIDRFSRREQWQIQKDALKAKFPRGWQPRKRLSPDALAGIRALHAQDPNTYSTPALAEQFKLSSEAIRRILRSKWKPSDGEQERRKQRWEKRGHKIWSEMAEKGVKPPKKWRHSHQSPFNGSMTDSEIPMQWARLNCSRPENSRERDYIPLADRIL